MPDVLRLDQAAPGVRVRVIGFPDRTGTIRTAPSQDDVSSVRVEFDAGVTRLTRLENLELLPKVRDVFSDIANGQVEGPDSLRRNLLHEKLQGRLTEVLYSMDTSDTTFFAYQFKPIIKLLESPTNSLLIADEVGLGKTVEAGLIWTELRAREGARSLLVVCPPHLITKWRNELKRRFGVDAKEGDAAEVLEALEDSRSRNRGGVALVASYHGLRPPKNWEDDPRSPSARLAEKLRQWGTEEEPFLDLLVMDEAAIMRNDDSQTSELGELLSPIARHKVYLSATPIHTKARNLFTLLKRLDPDTFPDEHTFNSILEANAPLVRLREKILRGTALVGELLTEIDAALASPLLTSNNTLLALRKRIEETSDLQDRRLRAELAYQSERANLLSYVVTRTRKRDVEQHPVIRDVNTVLVPLSELERCFYNRVTAAVWAYAETNDISAGFLTVMPQRQTASCMAAACRRLASGLQDEDDLDPDRVGSSGKKGDGPLVSFLKQELAGSFNAADLEKDDSKYKHLRAALRNYWQNHPGKKLVLFAYFKPTLYYLRERLQRDGIASLMLTGDEVGDKQEVVDKFAAASSETILLSSEVGSEGLDLQFASALVNYDLPWNPMVVEQRIGRIHRIGQVEDRIVIINLVCEGTVDQRIYDRLYSRLDLFRRTLGDLEAVIGPIINELTKNLLTHRLSDDQIRERVERTALAMEEQLRLEEELERDAGILAAYGDYVIGQITAAHDRKDWITGEELETFILAFFRLAFPATRWQGVDVANRIFQVELDSKAVYEFDRFLSDHQLRGLTRITTMETYRIRFDHRVYTTSDPRVEIIHHAHPIVRFAGHYLRVNRLIQPVPVAVEVAEANRPKDVQPGLYAFVSQRWTVEGLRSYERIQHQVHSLDTDCPIEDNAAANAIVEIASIFGAPPQVMPSSDDPLLKQLSELIAELEYQADASYHRFEEQCRLENTDRKQIQLRGLDRFWERRSFSIESRRNLYRVSGRNSLAAAMEGQLASLRKRLEAQREKIERQSKTHGECTTVAAGFILLN